VGQKVYCGRKLFSALPRVAQNTKVARWFWAISALHVNVALFPSGCCSLVAEIAPSFEKKRFGQHFLLFFVGWRHNLIMAPIKQQQVGPPGPGQQDAAGPTVQEQLMAMLQQFQQLSNEDIDSVPPELAVSGLLKGRTDQHALRHARVATRAGIACCRA
jgi:hypothetical protein